MTSEGLDVVFEEPTEKKHIKVTYGDLEGTFVSIDSKYNMLSFETSNIELAFKYISEPSQVATIAYVGFIQKFVWNNHNYKIKKGSRNTLIVTVEEINVQE
jgi:hypothetical protein